MSDPTKTFTDMFKSLGEQLKVPAFDMSKIMEQQQKNIDAMTMAPSIATPPEWFPPSIARPVDGTLCTPYARTRK